MSDIKPCPFCGAENPRSDSHADDCYFTLHRALNNAPEADLSLTFDVIEAWNRRAALQANVPDGWKSIAVTGFDDLIMALDRAYSKGYMPDAIEKYYEPFDHCALSSAPPVAQPERCPNCDDTGDVHAIDGQWRGTCHCPAGQEINSRQAQPAERKPLEDHDRIDCKHCAGKGWNWEWKAVSGHHEGREEFKEECKHCDGTGIEK